MAKKIEAKEVGLTTLLGAGVLVGTSLLSGPITGIHSVFAIEILPGILSVGSTIAAGASAFVIDLAITKWLS